MNDLKYVILIPKGMNINGSRAIIFNGMFSHVSMVGVLVAAGEVKVYSAGYVSFKNGYISCFGRSESLNAESKATDPLTIERTLLERHEITDMFAHDS